MPLPFSPPPSVFVSSGPYLRLTFNRRLRGRGLFPPPSPPVSTSRRGTRRAIYLPVKWSQMQISDLRLSTFFSFLSSANPLSLSSPLPPAESSFIECLLATDQRTLACVIRCENSSFQHIRAARFCRWSTFTTLTSLCGLCIVLSLLRWLLRLPSGIFFIFVSPEII